MDSGGAVLEAAHTMLADAISMRRDIHAHPELDLDNPRTQTAIVDALTDLGLEARPGDDCTSVVADLEGDLDGPTLLLRADMDALPMQEDSGESFSSTIDGRSHSCGHDAHVAMLVGAARLLVAERKNIVGRIRLMFQPGEEGAGGARVMIDEGVLDGVHSAFAIHVTPSIPSGLFASRPGPMMASADTFHITMRGQGGHASSPHHCTDPIPAVCAVVPALQTMITREVDAFTPAVLTVAHLQAGSTTNVIPETALVEGTFRAVSDAARQHVETAVGRVAEGVASAHNCAVDVEIRNGYPVTVNDHGQVDLVADTVRSAIGDNTYVEMPAPVMGAEDFSYVTAQVPGAMAFLGLMPTDLAPGQRAESNHSNKMRIDEEGMVNGIALHVAMALRNA